MREIREIGSYEGKQHCAITLGKFDGLHRGHQKLIRRVKEYASAGVESVVCAFDMGKESLLTGQERRGRLSAQVDSLVVCPFTKEIREMEAEVFIRRVLAETFHAAYIVVGTDFQFGRGKGGDAALLEAFAKQCGYHLDVIEKERYRGQVISSTYIKEALCEGNVELARALLGYPYQISGKVEHGRQLGRTLGFPTMNVAPEKGKIMPRFGVYACQIEIEGRCFPGIGNVGIKPTVTEAHRPLVEVFAFDYDGDAYGKEVTVTFCTFERPEEQFHSVEELQNRVRADIQFGKAYFS
ncbi:MAG: bifunctional riboflavin kinase/FAD synthetase [Ruminococcus sp.]|nr:bifunctional riboflavin kinase/FAD synthetase [Ruminococcus sp.]